MRETQLFEVRVSGGSLVMTLPRSAQVISWAPLHGGLRTHAQHIVIHCVESNISDAEMPRLLRRAASQARLSGTIVGMATTGRISDYGIAETRHDDLVAAALCSACVLGLQTVGGTRNNSTAFSSPRSRGAIHLAIAVNYGLTHEAMLEAMAIATEAKVRMLHELQLRSHETGQLATGASMDCVAIISGHDRRYTSAGKSSRCGELVGQATMQALRIAIEKALAPASCASPSRLRAAKSELSAD